MNNEQQKYYSKGYAACEKKWNKTDVGKLKKIADKADRATSIDTQIAYDMFAYFWENCQTAEHIKWLAVKYPNYVSYHALLLSEGGLK